MRAKSRRIGFLPGTDAALRFASSRIAPHGGPPISVQTCFARGREENPCLGPAPGPKNSTTMRQRAVLTAAREPQMLSENCFGEWRWHHVTDTLTLLESQGVLGRSAPFTSADSENFKTGICPRRR